MSHLHQTNESSSSFVTPPTSNHRISSTHQNTIYSMSRMSRIKDKRTIYPTSTLSKIVFVSNYEGNGFIRENVCGSDTPDQIDLDGMIKGINRACYEQWKRVFETMEEEPFWRWERAQRIVGYLIVAIVLVFLYFMMNHEFSYNDIILYILLGLLGLGCISSFILLKQKREQINKDEEMIRAIKRELIRLNENQLIQNPQCSRFTWTCQKQCLWIACEFH